MVFLSKFSETYNNEADVDIQEILEMLSISIDLMGNVTELSPN